MAGRLSLINANLKQRYITELKKKAFCHGHECSDSFLNGVYNWASKIMLRLPIFLAYFFCLSYKCVYLLLFFFVVIATISISTFP